MRVEKDEKAKEIYITPHADDVFTFCSSANRNTGGSGSHFILTIPYETAVNLALSITGTLDITKPYRRRN